MCNQYHQLRVERDQWQKKIPVYSVQVFSSLANDIISLSPSDGPGNVMNGVMGGRRTHTMQISRYTVWKVPVA